MDDDLRINYSKLWLALISAKKDKIQKICTKMGLREYFGLFVCIVTLRSWQSISDGLTKTEIDEKEVFFYF